MAYDKSHSGDDPIYSIDHDGNKVKKKVEAYVPSKSKEEKSRPIRQILKPELQPIRPKIPTDSARPSIEQLQELFNPKNNDWVINWHDTVDTTSVTEPIKAIHRNPSASKFENRLKERNNIMNSKMQGYTNDPKSKVVGIPGIKSDKDRGADVLKALSHSNGIFTKNEVNKLKSNRFTKRSFAIDPWNYVSKTYEILFFVKYDLHICHDGINNPIDKYNKSLVLLKELKNDPYFVRLREQYPNIIRQLQAGAPGTGKSYNNTHIHPFMNLLTYRCKGGLDIPTVNATTVDTPVNAFGTNYEYRSTGEASDDSISFSLEFDDGPDLEVYQLFKAYDRYEQLKNHGQIPILRRYVNNRVLHDQGGIYKFTLAEDLSTIIHYAYIWGAYPVSVPRDAFSQPINDGLSFSVDFKAAFIDDMDPTILSDFNKLTEKLWKECKKKKLAERYGFEYYATRTSKGRVINRYDFIDNELVVCPHIKKDEKKRYHLVWR